MENLKYEYCMCERHRASRSLVTQCKTAHTEDPNIHFVPSIYIVQEVILFRRTVKSWRSETTIIFSRVMFLRLLHVIYCFPIHIIHCENIPIQIN